MTFRKVKTKSKNEFIWKSNDAKVYVIDNPLAGWDVVIQYEGNETIENFPNKKEAIRYAKKWMDENY